MPFFYSKVKRDWICGATIYPNFKAWALGKPHERFLSPPSEDSEVMGQFKGVFDRIKSTGFGAVKERFEAGRRLAGSSPEGNDSPASSDKKGAFAYYGGVLTPKRRPATCALRK